jgi:NADH-quinone oxidoreductase subunit G
LVGKDSFYHGVSDNEHDLAELAIRILKDGPVRTPSMREVETADAVFILGEDLINSAPMLGLAVRQAAKQQPMKEASKAHIPMWHDAANREFMQDKNGPIFIATIYNTKLDEIATATYHSTPDDIARIGFAVAHALDVSAPAVEKLSQAEQDLVAQIAKTLSAAEKPVIISGASCESESVLKAAANVAWALQKKNSQTGLILTMLECNSIGLAMMGGHRLNAAFDAVMNGHADTVIIMENDLYRHGKTKKVSEFLQRCKHVIVIDSLEQPAMKKANVVVPAGTFAESDGTIVSNEGRAQRFFQVYEPASVIRESWRWLAVIGEFIGNQQMSKWRGFEDVTKAIAAEEILLRDVDKITPPADFRIAGQRVPREPHRYSGRTAMTANINVSEPKPPIDTDSSLSYTMEGLRSLPPSSMIPFFWSPGWNSVQSVNKYQEEVGADLRGGNPGLRLLEPSANPAKYFTAVPEIFQALDEQLWIMPLHHIFGSEELSARAAAVSQRLVKPYVLINKEDAVRLNVLEGQLLSIEIGGQLYQLPVVESTVIKKNTAGMPYGLAGMAHAELPAWGVIKR